MPNKSKFKKFVKGVDKYYRATKEGLTVARRDLKSGYNTFTTTAKENLDALNRTGFVADARRGLNNAIPYMKKGNAYAVVSLETRDKIATCLANNIKQAQLKTARQFNIPIQIVEKNFIFIKENY